MANNIPDGISFKELEAMLEEAPKDAENKSIDELSFEDICEMAASAKSELFEKTQSPLAMKMLLLMVLTDMEAWHQRMAWAEYKEHEMQQVLNAWLKDAGQIQSMRNTLIDIEITREDPTPTWKCLDDN